MLFLHTVLIALVLDASSPGLWPTEGLLKTKNNVTSEAVAERQCGVLLVDFEQFFDTLRHERLFHKMQVLGIPDQVVALWKELARTHCVKVVFKKQRGSAIRVLVGVPQGSGWSPELATLYVDDEDGLAGKLKKHRYGVVELPGGCLVHLIMLADDLLTPNVQEDGMQQQFDVIELVAESDGLRVSYKKNRTGCFPS